MVLCRFCKGVSLKAKKSDLLNHAKSERHKKASEPFSSARQSKLQFSAVTNDCAKSEAAAATFICCHSSIAVVDHLVDMCKYVFPDSKVAQGMKMHRTKCTAVIREVLAPHFRDDLLKDIGGSSYSLLLDESNNVTVIKMLGVIIVYYSKAHKKIVSTFLGLVELSACDAQAIFDAVITLLKDCRLDVKLIKGIGSDNASVMVGINNGVHAKLKEVIPNVILIRCTCHSLQLALSHAVEDSLPRHLDFIVRETYNWFSHSSARQLNYKLIYKAINDGKEPLKLLQPADTRWISIEPATNRIIQQWLELKTHFGVVKDSEKCYTAHTLFNMYQNEVNLAYFMFLQPVLSEVQRVNKSFEGNNVDPTKLLEVSTYI